MTAPSVRTVRLTLPADASEPGDAYRPVMLPFLHAVSGYDPELTRAIDEYALAALGERVLDPVTTELARLIRGEECVLQSVLIVGLSGG
jgi:hypothetical protein